MKAQLTIKDSETLRLDLVQAVKNNINVFTDEELTELDMLLFAEIREREVFGRDEDEEC